MRAGSLRMRSKRTVLALPHFRKQCPLIFSTGYFFNPTPVVRTALLCSRHVWGRGDDGFKMNEAGRITLTLSPPTTIYDSSLKFFLLL